MLAQEKLRYTGMAARSPSPQPPCLARKDSVKTMKARCLSSFVLIAAAACGDSDGRDGDSSLTLTADEPAGSNCAFGGVSISTGIDGNGNGKLDESESPTVRYVCNGVGGSNGQNGQNGDGGISAFQPVVNTSAAPASSCPAGGVQITVGFDRNGDGDILDSGETNGEPRYLCNGTGGDLVQAGEEAPGTNCPVGGIRIENGRDANQNGKLDTGEISATTFSCTKPGLANGSSPIVVAPAPEPTSFPTSKATPPTPGGTAIELNTATITVPAKGSILAIASSSAYCDATDPTVNCAPSPFFSVANFTIVQSGQGAQTGTSGSPQALFLTPGVEVTLATTEVFGVAGAGTYSFRVLGQAGFNNSTGAAVPPGSDTDVQFAPAELTLVFIPN